MTRIVIALVALLALPGTASALTPFRPAGIDSTDRIVDAAEAAVEQRPSLFDGAETDELVIADVERSPSGARVVRMAQEVGGIPVLGGEVVVAVDGSRRVVAGSGEVFDGQTPNTIARIGSLTAIGVAREEAAQTIDGTLTVERAALAIYDPRIVGTPGPPRAVLVWDIRLGIPGTEQWRRVMVDAQTGVVAFAAEDTPYALDRRVCDAANAKADLPCGPSRYVKTESSPTPGNADVENAFTFAGQTYDYFARLGRDSVDGLGMPIISTVRYCKSGCPYNNASWNGSQMVYGTGWTVDDIVGHELTHGVTEFTSGLFYWYQSGAINEALSDIHGEFVDLENPGTGAVADRPEDRWEIGEDLSVTVGWCNGATRTKEVRDMADPPRCLDPDKVTSSYYYGGVDDNGGVHWNSGVVNKTAYLIADGDTFNGQSVAGIGLSKSAKLWYQAGTLLRSGSNFADLAIALQQGCALLAREAWLTSSDCTQVEKAIAATQLTSSTAETHLADTPVCESGTRVDLFADDFESDPNARWSFDTTDATKADWDWNADYAASGRADLWGAYVTPGTGDATVTLRSTVAIPAGSVYLRFAHATMFGTVGGSTVAGGAVEYRIGSGEWTSVAALPTQNGYNGTIPDAVGHPLRNRGVFTGYSRGMQTTRVNLSSLTGDEPISLRFRLGSKSAGASGATDYGWFVDDVAVYECADGGSTPTTSVSVLGADARAQGSVISAASGIACDVGGIGTCVAASPSSIVTLTAVPGIGSVFEGWSGACTGASARCTVTGTQSNDVTATFSRPQYPVSIAFAGTGGGTVSMGAVTCTTACTNAISRAETVTLTATPSASSTFAGWSGACSGTGTCAVTVLDANFILATFTALSNTDPSGGGDVSPAPNQTPLLDAGNRSSDAAETPVLAPRTVKWTAPTSSGVVSSTFPAAAGTTYRIGATFRGRAGKTVKGKCAVKAGKATCTVKLRKGRWLIAITPVAGGVVGKPVTRTVRVR